MEQKDNNSFDVKDFYNNLLKLVEGTNYKLGKIQSFLVEDRYLIGKFNVMQESFIEGYGRSCNSLGSVKISNRGNRGIEVKLEKDRLDSSGGFATLLRDNSFSFKIPKENILISGDCQLLVSNSGLTSTLDLDSKGNSVFKIEDYP